MQWVAELRNSLPKGIAVAKHGQGSREAWMATWKSRALGVMKERRHTRLHKSPQLKSVELREHIRKAYAYPIHLLPWVPAYDQCWRQVLGLDGQMDRSSIFVLIFQPHKFQESVCCSIKREMFVHISTLIFSPVIASPNLIFSGSHLGMDFLLVNYSKS